MMNSYLLPHIGKVIASTGSRHFPRMLHDLILTQLTVDATHISQLRVSAAGNSRQGANPVYSESVTTGDEAGARAQLHLTRRKDDYRYVLSVYRSTPSQHFSEQERSLLEDFSSVLLPMVEKHITAVQPCAPAAAPHSPGIQALRQRFEERLAQSGLTLSTRELEVCLGLLAGRTAPELAEQLALKVNTIESYLKRAAIKMGISGRHSLMRWMYSVDEAPAH